MKELIKTMKEFKIADVPTEIITPKSLERYPYNPIFKQSHPEYIAVAIQSANPAKTFV
jgi:hypothetical protein